jgi:hypothetical protein
VAGVATECGSHTATAVPDPDNGRLLVYSSAVDEACPGFDIIGFRWATPGARPSSARSPAR